MSRSYKKICCSGWDDNNSGRRKSFKTPLMRQAINALRRKGIKPQGERKSVTWDWEFQSIPNFLEALDSSSRSCDHNERTLYEGYLIWLRDHSNAKDTEENRVLFAKSQIRSWKRK